MRQEDAMSRLSEAHYFSDEYNGDKLKLLIEDIYRDFESVEHDLRCAIDHYIEQTSIYKGALDRVNDEIKNIRASNDSLAKLNSILNGMLQTQKD